MEEITEVDTALLNSTLEPLAGSECIVGIVDRRVTWSVLKRTCRVAGYARLCFCFSKSRMSSLEGDTLSIYLSIEFAFACGYEASTTDLPILNLITPSSAGSGPYIVGRSCDKRNHRFAVIGGRAYPSFLHRLKYLLIGSTSSQFVLN